MFWFTADSHFNHDNIIQYCDRPFADLLEMREVMIRRWNERVAPGDIVFHLGDFALSWGGKHKVTIARIINRLNGQLWLIKGNHDRDEVTRNPRWIKVKDYHEIKVDLGGKHKQRIVMCHYPLASWSQMHRGSFMLHGHCHGSLEDRGGKIMDVGVDIHDFRPISLDDVVEFMSSRAVVTKDHHELA